MLTNGGGGFIKVKKSKSTKWYLRITWVGTGWSIKNPVSKSTTSPPAIRTIIYRLLSLYGVSSLLPLVAVSSVLSLLAISDIAISYVLPLLDILPYLMFCLN